EALALVAREAEGSLRDAQSLLEQVLTVVGSGADDAAVRQVLGAADRRLVVAVADAILAGDPGACVRHLAELHAHGYDAQRFCRRCSRWTTSSAAWRPSAPETPPPPAVRCARARRGRARPLPPAACGTGSWRACRRRSWSRPT